MIAGERVLVLHGPLAVDVAEEPAPILPDLRLPVDPDLQSVDRVGESLLRLSLVRDLVEEGLPAVGVSGVDLGLFRRGADGDLKIDANRLTWLLSGGILPVIGVDCLNPDGTVGRTTASEVTRTLALARDIHSVDVIARTDRVLQFDGSEALALQLGDLQRLRTRAPDHFPSDPVSQSAIESALAALENGVPTARIGSIASLVNGTATEVTQAGRGVVVR
jgi:acetylglutamate kinase